MDLVTFPNRPPVFEMMRGNGSEKNFILHSCNMSHGTSFVLSCVPLYSFPSLA